MEREEATRWVEFYLRNGFAVVWTDGKTDEAAKRVTRKGWQETQPLEGELASLAGTFAERIKSRNPAVVTRASGLIAVDCDDEEGLAAFQALDPPETLTVRTSAPYKRHFYFRAPPDAEYCYFEFAGGIVKAKTTQYLLLPPARHPTGAIYGSVNGSEITDWSGEA